MKRFTLKPEHLTLLERASWQWENCEFGAPAIDPKRPFGFSVGIENEIIELAGWKADHGEYLDDQARILWRETLDAIDVVFSARSCEPGAYVFDEAISKWRRDGA